MPFASAPSASASRKSSTKSAFSAKPMSGVSIESAGPESESASRFDIRQAMAFNDKTNGHVGISPPVALSGWLRLSTCNSGFLTSLLADVAKAKQEMLRKNNSANDADKKRSSASSSQMVDLEPSSIKRRRISMDACGSKAALVAQTNKPWTKTNLVGKDPNLILDLLWEESWLTPGNLLLKQQQQESSRVAPPPAPPQDHRQPAPKIPATVSESFEGLLEDKIRSITRARNSNNNVEMEDTFGWFVDMDDDQEEDNDTGMVCDDSHRSYQTAAIAESLAFSAPIAPKASSYDHAQVEWAKAADTVDHVLGDLF